MAKWYSYSRTNTYGASKSCTVTHVPPENWRDIHTPRGPAFDVYSFGVMLWELMTQKVPFAVDSGAQGWCSVFRSLIIILIIIIINNAFIERHSVVASEALVEQVS